MLARSHQAFKCRIDGESGSGIQKIVPFSFLFLIPFGTSRLAATAAAAGAGDAYIGSGIPHPYKNGANQTQEHIIKSSPPPPSPRRTSAPLYILYISEQLDNSRHDRIHRVSTPWSTAGHQLFKQNAIQPPQCEAAIVKLNGEVRKGK